MTAPALYRRHRFPSEVISHWVWLYFRFSISYRDVEEMMAVRGLTLTYETIRHWCLKFGQTYANGLRRSRPRSGDRWPLDEVFLKINGQVQRFLSVFGVINSHLRPGRHLCTAGVYREMMKRRCAVWEEVVVGAPAAV
jgi:hypothetical protein